MLKIQDKIYKEYKILYDHGYVNENIEDNGLLFSSLICSNPNTGIIFNFFIEKGITTIVITTKKLFLKEKKFIDFFYILKVLYPNKSFENILHLSYKDVVSIELLRIERLFSDEQISNTISKANLIEKEYSKVRWKLER